MSVSFSTALLSEMGGRTSNQDCIRYAAGQDCYCWTLADGLGGQGGGELAAGLAVQSILASFEAHAECSPSALRTYLEGANAAIVRGQQENPAQSQMRTTVVLLLAHADGALWAHVGDSRLYFLHGGRIVRQTKDHSVPQAMADAGKISEGEIRFHEDRNRLLRSVGSNGELGATIEEKPQRLAAGDAFLLASDGLWEYVKEREIEVEFAKAATPQEWLDGMVGRLRSRVQDGNDNYSGVAIFVGH